MNYLDEIVTARFSKGPEDMSYRKVFDGLEKSMTFLKNIFDIIKDCVKFRKRAREIEADKKTKQNK